MERKTIYTERKAVYITEENKNIDYLFSLGLTSVAINDSSWLTDDLNKLEYTQVSAPIKPTIKIKDELAFSYYVWGSPKTILYRIKNDYWKTEIVVFCIDNWNNAQWESMIHNMSEEEFKEVVDIFNRDNIKVSIPMSTYRTLEECSPHIKFPRTPSVSDLKDYENGLQNSLKYGQLWNKERYYSDKPVYKYDLNAAYPTVLAHFGLATGINDNIGNYDYDDECYYKVSITNGTLKDNYIPFEQNNIADGFKIVGKPFDYADFNADNYIGIISYEEYLQLQESYDNIDIEILDTYYYRYYYSQKLFDAINDIYKKSKEGTGFEKVYNKLKRNSFTGVLGMLKQNPTTKTTHFLLLAHVRYFIREVAHRIMSMGYEFIACDTDSITTTMPPEVFDTIAYLDDKKMGTFKVECEYSEFYQHGKKQYCGVTSDGEFKATCAGYSTEDISNSEMYKEFVKLSKKIENNSQILETDPYNINVKNNEKSKQEVLNMTNLDLNNLLNNLNEQAEQIKREKELRKTANDPPPNTPTNNQGTNGGLSGTPVDYNGKRFYF